jgi:hypothetical protein
VFRTGSTAALGLFDSATRNLIFASRVDALGGAAVIVRSCSGEVLDAAVTRGLVGG